MRSILSRRASASLFLLGLGIGRIADDYTIDAGHSSVSFKIKHFGLSYVHGRFNSFSRRFHHRFRPTRPRRRST